MTKPVYKLILNGELEGEVAYIKLFNSREYLLLTENQISVCKGTVTIASERHKWLKVLENGQLPTYYDFELSDNTAFDAAMKTFFMTPQ